MVVPPREGAVYVGLVVVTVILAGLLAFSAVRKLTHRPAVVESYARVGVPENRLNLLAGLLAAGAVGVVGGLFLPALGVAAAAAIVVYFVVAVGFHVRSGQLATVGTPVVLVALAAAALVLRLITI